VRKLATGVSFFYFELLLFQSWLLVISFQEMEIVVYLVGAGGAVFLLGAFCLCCRRRLEQQKGDRSNNDKATNPIEGDGENLVASSVSIAACCFISIVLLAHESK